MGIHPVVLGQDKLRFSTLPNPAELRLISAMPFASGTVAAIHQPA